MAGSGFDQIEHLVGRLKPARWKDPEPVRNFTVDGCTPAVAGASVDALHPSRTPLAADEIEFWPTDLKILDEVYVKELTVRSLDGRQSRLLLPLFNRHRLRGYGALTPNIYQALSVKSRPSVRVAFRTEVDLSQLTRVPESDRTSSKLAVQDGSARVPVYECNTRRECNTRTRLGRRRLRFDAVTLLEALIATDEPMFRLLLSPFRELNVMQRQVDGVACVAVTDASAFEPRDGLSKASTTTFSVASCLAYWFGEVGMLSELAACARSILGAGPLYVPKGAGITPVKIRGYQLDGYVQVQRMTPARASSFWPLTSRHLVIIDIQKETGRRFDAFSRETTASRRARTVPASTVLDESEYREYRAWFE